MPQVVQYGCDARTEQEPRIGTLYVVATPIGNLEDITLRALRVLREVPLIAAEDTRRTRRLLARHDIPTRVTSFHEHSSESTRAALLEQLERGDLALVTDAGTPAVSDPGSKLVRDARGAGHVVVAVPGPSAVTAALSVAGMPADQYVFLGFLPRRAVERRLALEAIADEPRTAVAFETPHRLRASLGDMLDVLGDRPVAVGRELTKLHEETYVGTLSSAVEHWSQVEPRGEFTLVLAGASITVSEAWSDEQVRSALGSLREAGFSAREASKQLADQSGRASREIYKLWHEDDDR